MTPLQRHLSREEMIAASARLSSHSRMVGKF